MYLSSRFTTIFVLVRVNINDVVLGASCRKDFALVAIAHQNEERYCLSDYVVVWSCMEVLLPMAMVE